MPAQLVANDLHFAHGPVPVLSGVDVTVASGHRLGIVGPNGVGKSTLLALLTGDLAPDAGTVEVVPGDATVGHLTQELYVRSGETVAEVVRRRTGVAAAQRELDASTEALAEGTTLAGVAADVAYDRALHRWLRLGGADLEHRLGAVLDRVGLGADHRDQPAESLSGGERARVNLASVLLSGFDLLALDEPTNDLDLAGLELLESFLLGADVGIVLVSHDRAFLERVTTGIVEISEHQRTATRFEGGWQAYLDQRAASRRHAAEAYGDFVDRRAALQAQMQRATEWSAKGVRSQRRAPDDNDKMLRDKRIEASENLAGKSKRAQRALDRLDAVDKPWEGWELRLDFADRHRSGEEVLALRDVEIRRGGFRLGPIDLDVGYGERVALVGPNGSGKTTLLDLCLGLVAPDAGTVRTGASVVTGTLDQHRSRFAGDAPLLDVFVAETGVAPTDARSQLAKLGLGVEHVSRPTSALSPGERTRAVLAAFALVGVNLMVLDEPTNHLDLPAIEQLEQALDSYRGTLLLVTHDRRMLEHVATTRTIELSEGRVVADRAA